MSETWRGLGRSLIRRVCCRSSIGFTAYTFSAIFAFLPLVVFGNILDPYEGSISQIRIFSYSSHTNTVFQQFTLKGVDSVFSFYASHVFGFSMNRLTSIEHPSYPSSTNDFGSSSIDRQVCFGGASFYASPRGFSSIDKLYVFGASLVDGGYNGPGLVLMSTLGSRTYWNFDYKLVVADILSSTNTVFRQILLQHLSSIQSSVANIEVNMAGVTSAVESGNDMLSNIVQNTISSAEDLHSIDTNVSNINLTVSLIHSGVSDIGTTATTISGHLVDLKDAWTLSNIDLFLGDDTQNWIDFLDLTVSAGYISQSDATTYANALVSTDPTRGGSKSYTIPQAHRRFYVKNQIKHTCVEAQKMCGKYQFLAHQLGYDNGYDGLSGVSAVISGTLDNKVVRPIVGGVGQSLNDWREDLHQRLQDWKTSDERGILNVRHAITNELRGVMTNYVNNFQVITNNVVPQITNAVQNVADHVDDAASAISSNVVDQAEQSRRHLDTWFDDGIQVKIKEPRNHDPSCVSVYDPQLGELLSGFGAIADLSAEHWQWLQNGGLIHTTNSFDWLPWFDRWDPWATNTLYFYNDYHASQTFGVSAYSDMVFGNGFNEEKFGSLPWFNRVELLLYQIHKALSATNEIETADIEQDLEDQVVSFQNVGTNFVMASTHVVGFFRIIKRFTDSVQLAFESSASPSTDGIILLPGGSWLVDEPLVLRIPIEVQNALRLVFQCIWYLSALIIGWRIVSSTWEKVISFIRWLWSVFDI